jgi:transposase
MESTGSYSYGVAAYLCDANYHVSLENPRYIKHWAHGMRHQNKTDKADSRIIALYAKTVNPSVWSMKDPIHREIKSLLGRITELDKVATAENNRLEDTALPESIKASINRTLQYISFEKDQVIDHLQSILDKNVRLAEMVDVLTREPSIGEFTALQFLSHIEWDPTKFLSAQQAAASAGFNPVRRESGTSKGRSHISKNGPQIVRSAFYMATLTAITYNPRIKSFYEKLISKGKCKMSALIACARKLFMILFGIVKAFKAAKPITYSGEKKTFRTIRGKQKAIQTEAKVTALAA